MAIPRLPAPIGGARPPAPPSASAVAQAILSGPRLPATQPTRPPATTGGGNRPPVIEGTARVIYPTSAKAPNFASMNWLSTNLRQNGAGQWVLPRSSANPNDMANSINMKSTQAALAKVGNLRGPEAVKKLESMATTPAARKAIYIGLPLLAAAGMVSWLTVGGFSDEVPVAGNDGGGFGGGAGNGDGLPPLPDGGALPNLPMPPMDGGLPFPDMGGGLPSPEGPPTAGLPQEGTRTFLSLNVSKTQLGASVAFSFTRGPVPIVDKGFQVGSYHYPLVPVLLDDGVRETVRALKSRMNGDTIVTVALVTELVRQLGIDAVVSLFAERNQ